MTAAGAIAAPSTPERCTVGEYLAGLLATLTPLASETVALDDAFGRVLAVNVVAAQPVPLFDNAAMDGYAVRTEDVLGSGPEHPARLRVVAHIAAGSSEHAAVGRGEAVRIMTGAPLPPGADRVIAVESTLSGCFEERAYVDVWAFADGAPAKAHIRRAGEDIASGTALFDAGRTLGARDIGLLAATGHTAVSAMRRPRVGVVSTGDELVRTGGSDRAGIDGRARIPDSNALYLAAALQSLGAEVALRVAAPDDPALLEAALDRAARNTDLVISTGGLGAGSHDFVRHAIVAGTHAAASRWASVDMKPGRPQAHGSWRGVPWIALPGNPTAVLVSFESFVRPAIARLGGARPVPLAEPTAVSAAVSSGWTRPATPTRFVPLTRLDRDGGPSVSEMAGGSHRSHFISAMFTAPLIGVVTSDAERTHAGDVVRVFEPA